MTSPANYEEPGPEQPFMSHLVELRDRLLRMVMAIVLVFLVLFPFANDIYTFIAEPIRAQLPEGSTMIATQVASPFLTPFKLALVAAVFVAMPYLLFQVWGFVAPGLYQHEKRFALPLVASSIILFYLGMAFAYFVVFPLVFAFFSSVTPDDVAQMPDIAFYLEFVLKLLFAFGVAFEIPIATILLVAMGMTTPERLGTKRPYVIVGVFVAGMLLTPPDVISQTLLAIPMWMLFEAGIFFSRFFLPGSNTDEPSPATAAGGTAAGTAGADMPDSPPGEGLDPAPGTASHTTSGKAGSEDLVGRDISGGDPFDKDRFTPMSDEEMDAELDAIEAQETPEVGDPESAEDDDENPHDPVDAMLAEIGELREREDEAGARTLLYRVLSEGDESQRRVAMNILEQLDN
jgi:sec-independent protein translocase protein TatC